MRKLLIALFMTATFFSNVMAAQEFGLASMYSPKFQGSKTAFNEAFDHNAFTAAHRKYPHNTLLKITRTDNNKWVVVRVNDRGPFLADRVTELSRAAAQKLGLSSDKEEVRVKIEVCQNCHPGETGTAYSNTTTRPQIGSKSATSSVPPLETFEQAKMRKSVENMPKTYSTVSTKAVIAETRKKPTPQQITVSNKSVATRPHRTGFAIQVAMMTAQSSVKVKTAELKGKSIANIIVKEVSGNDGNPDYKILVGTYATRKEAETELKKLKQKKIKGFIVDMKSI